MEQKIRLFVGLGNPGEKYTHTRHNAGAWLVETLAEVVKATLHEEPMFHGRVGCFDLLGQKIRLLIPSTFMNASGQSVRAMSQFYRIPPQAILVAHDELDFPPGIIRLKQHGGHGGHNGLRDIITHLHTDEFARLRIGIGHPGERSKVEHYVLTRPSEDDRAKIMAALQQVTELLPELTTGKIQTSIKKLHTMSANPLKTYEST